MRNIYIALLTFIFSYNAYSQISISNSSNGIVTLTYNDSSNGWALYDPLSEPTIYVYVWVESIMNSTTNKYEDNWFDSGSLNTITWDGSNYIGTINLNTHDFLFLGGVFPTGTLVTDFNFILRNNDGTRQSGNLLATNYGFQTPPYL